MGILVPKHLTLYARSVMSAAANQTSGAMEEDAGRRAQDAGRRTQGAGRRTHAGFGETREGGRRGVERTSHPATNTSPSNFHMQRRGETAL